MFGFVSKKKIIEIVKPLAKKYNNPVIEKKTNKNVLTNFITGLGTVMLLTQSCTN